MQLPEYLTSLKLFALPVGYKWTRVIANGFFADPAEKNPKLYDALQLIDVRASLALAVACCEWITARLGKLADDDALQRIQAAWAATIDWRYASLPEPPAPQPALDPITEPLWVAKILIADSLTAYKATYAKGKDQGVRSAALSLAVLGYHVIGKRSPFEKWLTATLRKAAEHYPASEQPVNEEAPVPREFFEPDFTFTKDAVQMSQARLLAELDPSKNPYLRSRDEMQADGFLGDPYPHLR